MEGMDVTREDCLEWIKASSELFKEKAVGLYLIYQEGSIVGYAGFSKAHEGINNIEVLFAILKEYSGKGLATEVCSALLEASSTYLKNSRVVAVAHPENIASVKVLKKCGFVPSDSTDGELSHLLHFEL
jgi:RimJ/RimL family protein N-acetyltransferase